LSPASKLRFSLFSKYSATFLSALELMAAPVD
jgi:hypothetical protein